MSVSIFLKKESDKIILWDISIKINHGHLWLDERMLIIKEIVSNKLFTSILAKTSIFAITDLSNNEETMDLRDFFLIEVEDSPRNLEITDSCQESIFDLFLRMRQNKNKTETKSYDITL